MKFFSTVLFLLSFLFGATNVLAQQVQVPEPPCSVRFMASVNEDTLNKLLDDIARPDVCSGPAQLLKIKIQSGGGLVDPAIFTYMQLRERGNVETRIDHSSASAAVLLFLAGDKRVMKLGSTLLVHRVSQVVEIDLDDDSLHAEVNRDFAFTKEDYVRILAERTGQSTQKVKELMAARTHLSAEEALRLGFATSVEK